MPSVVIRNLPVETKQKLVSRARRFGRSLEEELRQILDAAARSGEGSPDDDEPFGDWLVAITRPGHDDFADIVAGNRGASGRALPDFG